MASSITTEKGWEVHIYYPVPLYNYLTLWPDGDVFKYIIPQIIELTFSDVMSDTGAGSVTFALPGAIPLALSQTEFMLAAYMVWDGEVKFRWITESTQITFAEDAAGVPLCTIAGRGYACLHEISGVVPEGWPFNYDPDDPHITHWMFENTTPAEIFIQVEGYTRESFAIPTGDISYTTQDYFFNTFSTTNDSKGGAFAHTIDFDLSPGGDQLQLMRKMAEAAGCQWHVNRNKQLDWAPQLGNDFSETLAFNLGSDFTVAKTNVDRRAIAYYIMTLGQNGRVGLASPGDGVIPPLTTGIRDTIGWKELVIDTANATTVDTVHKFAELLYYSHTTPPVSVTIKTFRKPGKEPFVDFWVGDMIWLNFGDEYILTEGDDVFQYNGAYQVAAISIKVSASQGEQIELTMVSKSQLLIQRIQLEIERQTRGVVRANSELQVQRNVSADGVIQEPPPPDPGGGGDFPNYNPDAQTWLGWGVTQGASGLSSGFPDGFIAKISPNAMYVYAQVEIGTAGTATNPIRVTGDPGFGHHRTFMGIPYTVLDSGGASGSRTGIATFQAGTWRLRGDGGELGLGYTLPIGSSVILSGVVFLSESGSDAYDITYPPPS